MIFSTALRKVHFSKRHLDVDQRVTCSISLCSFGVRFVSQKFNFRSSLNLLLSVENCRRGLKTNHASQNV